MFQVQDTVFYPSGGVCVIDDIRIVPFDGLPDRNYYIIHPIERPQETFFVPVDSDKVKLRRLIDREQALTLMEKVNEIEPIAESNLKLLKERIAASMAMYECVEWFRVIRTVHHHNAALAGRSKRVSDTERAYAETAKRYLYAELSAVLDIPLSEIEDRITQCAESAR